MSQTHRAKLPSGIEIEYDDWGTGSRPLVLVHGFTGSRDDWREHLPKLAERGRTIAIDQRGHGGSTKTGKRGSYTLEQLAEDLEALHTELGLESWDLLGHSLGGMVVLRFALACPERVASLILMDTSPYGLELAPRALIEGGARLAKVAGMKALAGIMREGNRRDPKLSKSTQRYIESVGEDAWWARSERKICQMEADSFAGLGVALTEQEAVTDRLRDIRCPTTVIVGEEDEAFIAPSETMAREIPGAVHVVLENASHLCQLETPEAWLATIEQHLDRARGETR